MFRELFSIMAHGEGQWLMLFRFFANGLYSTKSAYEIISCVRLVFSGEFYSANAAPLLLSSKKYFHIKKT
ncbi:hypothetical protein ACJX0J_039213, partial [Zea mays]